MNSTGVPNKKLAGNVVRTNCPLYIYIVYRAARVPSWNKQISDNVLAPADGLNVADGRCQLKKKNELKEIIQVSEHPFIVKQFF